jgi:predicted metal-dependent hydrolase
MATYILLVIIVIIIISLFNLNANNEIIYITSTNINDNYHYLVRNLDDKQKAANLLSYANTQGLILIEHLIKKYPDDARIIKLQKNYDPNSLSESSTDSEYTSYTVNKGEKVILCLRNTDNSLIDKNTLMYVYIHELAHIMTKKIGHIDEFWQNFKFILKEAQNLRIYEYEDYSKNNKPYCGIKITNNILDE